MQNAAGRAAILRMASSYFARIPQFRLSIPAIARRTMRLASDGGIEFRFEGCIISPARLTRVKVAARRRKKAGKSIVRKDQQ